MTPNPRKAGQTGGSRYNKVNRSTHASARVHQKAGKSGCLGVAIVTLVAASVLVYNVGALLV